MAISMAQLGRDAERTVAGIQGRQYGITHFVNKTKKYVSIKLCTEHLTPEQLEEVSRRLSAMHPDRFLKVYNNTATPGRFDYIGGEFKAHSWKEDKINVRFTQA